MNFFKKAHDPVSSETHFIGAVASLVGLIVMLIVTIVKQLPPLTYVSIITFGLSSIALYSASSIYHYYNASDDNKIKLILRKLDHSMIYVLIAGTYTPIALTFVSSPHSYYFVLAIWAVALVGIIVKLFWMNAPRFVSTLFYLLMGWALVFDFPAFSQVPLGCFALIALGGVSYSIGAFIYIFEKPNWFKEFGFHELFHILVMIGSFFHFLAIIIYVL